MGGLHRERGRQLQVEHADLQPALRRLSAEAVPSRHSSSLSLPTTVNLTPLLWEHVHFVGAYRFEEPVIVGELLLEANS
jgi:hypothetical protein